MLPQGLVEVTAQLCDLLGVLIAATGVEADRVTGQHAEEEEVEDDDKGERDGGAQHLAEDNTQCGPGDAGGPDRIRLPDRDLLEKAHSLVSVADFERMRTSSTTSAMITSAATMSPMMSPVLDELCEVSPVSSAAVVAPGDGLLVGSVPPPSAEMGSTAS